MRAALWPDQDASELAADCDLYLRGEDRLLVEVLVAESEGRLVGMIELSIRPYAEGCLTNHVAYVEAWFVEPEWRDHGIGRALIRAAEDWGSSQGCTELGSDADLGNEDSIAAHQALGFAEGGRIICFHKRIERR